jgi:hypothetical protein
MTLQRSPIANPQLTDATVYLGVDIAISRARAMHQPSMIAVLINAT